MRDILLFFCIVFPFLAGAVAYFDKSNANLKRLTMVTSVLLGVSALLLSFYAPDLVLAKNTSLGSALTSPILVLDFVLLGVIIWIGIKQRHNLIFGLGALQLAGMVYLEFWHTPTIQPETVIFNIDSLAITLLLVVSIIGPLIARYAIDYMKSHEEHLEMAESRQPVFFAIVFVFLGAMNGLALADDLSWIYFFWEITTLCSYFLISHDRTEEAQNNACVALWMNMAGGVAFVFALIYFQLAFTSLSIHELLAQSTANGVKPIAILLPVVALCFAGFTKSAQMPFQSWLCGAMVAPTPVSALLHSSTMVKAGVYLVIRLAPFYAGSAISPVIAICGGFTFFVTAALACGQSNGKKILAYSTISNLGLIIACAGINTTASIAAALMLFIFHAISKALLFLCVGNIEQKIGSRDIEDMRGLFTTYPKIALITTFAILSMMLPPFGMLLSKWMALESAAEALIAMPFIVSLLALGSGLTVFFWARWAGIMLGSTNPLLTITKESFTTQIDKVLKTLCYMILAFSLFAPVLYVWLVEPAVGNLVSSDGMAYSASSGGISNSYGVFAVYPIYLIIAGGFWYAWREAKRFTSSEYLSLPYLSGQQKVQDGEIGFEGPMKSFVKTQTANLYLEAIFGENKISRTANIIAIVLLAMLLGGVAQ